MKTKTNADLMLEWYERVWNQCDASAIHELLDPSCEIEGLGSPVKGPDEFLQFHRGLTATFKDIHVDTFEIVEIDNRTLGHSRYQAVHQPTPKPIDFVFSFSVTWENGKAVNGRNVADFATLLIQIGALTPETLSTAFQPAPMV